MAIIEMNAEMTETTRQLKRIADALVEFLRAAYNIHLEPVRADRSTAKDAHEVDYSDDNATLRQTLLDVDRGLDPLRGVDVDEPEY